MGARLFCVLVKPGLQMKKGQPVARPEFVARMDGPDQIAALPAAAMEVFKKVLLEESLVAQVSLKDTLIARPLQIWGEEAGSREQEAGERPEADFELAGVALERVRFKREEKEGQPETKMYFSVELAGREAQWWAARNCGKKLWVNIKSEQSQMNGDSQK